MVFWTNLLPKRLLNPQASFINTYALTAGSVIWAILGGTPCSASHYFSPV